jgi:hypothetical protein
VKSHLQKAVKHLSKAGGGRIILNPGKYYIDPGFTMHPGVTLEGPGGCKAIFKAVEIANPTGVYGSAEVKDE